MQRMRNLYTLPNSEFTAENQWLEDEVSFWGPVSFQGHSLLVLGRLTLKFSMEPEILEIIIFRLLSPHLPFLIFGHL